MKQRSEIRESLLKYSRLVVALVFLVGAISPVVAQAYPLVRAGTKWLSEPLLQFLLKPMTGTALKDMATKEVAGFLVYAPIRDLPRGLLYPSHGQSFGDGQQWQEEYGRQTPNDLLRIMREVGEEILSDLLNSPPDTLQSCLESWIHQLFFQPDTSFYRERPSSIVGATTEPPRVPDSLSLAPDSVVYFATLASVILEARHERMRGGAGYTELADDDIWLAIQCLYVASRCDHREGIELLRAGVAARDRGRNVQAARTLCKAEVHTYRSYYVGLRVLAFQKMYASHVKLNSEAMREAVSLLPLVRLMARPTQKLKHQALEILRHGGPFSEPHHSAPASPDSGRARVF